MKTELNFGSSYEVSSYSSYSSYRFARPSDSSEAKCPGLLRLLERQLASLDSVAWLVQELL